MPVDGVLGRSFPFIDGQVVVASPGTAFSRGREAKIPLLIGANSNEATLLGNNDATARRALGDRYDAFLTAYAAARPGAAAKPASTELAEDALSILPSLSIAAMHAAHGAPAYGYVFSQVPANRRAGSAGRPHGGELEYRFGNPDAGSVWDASDRAVSDATAAAWVRFARTGKPDLPGQVPWPRVASDGALGYMVIGTPSGPGELSPVRQEVRKTALAASLAGWAREP